MFQATNQMVTCIRPDWIHIFFAQIQKLSRPDIEATEDETETSLACALRTHFEVTAVSQAFELGFEIDPFAPAHWYCI